MSSDDDSDIQELLNTSSSEADEDDAPPPPPQKEEEEEDNGPMDLSDEKPNGDFRTSARYKYVISIGQTVIDALPVEPDKPIDKIIHYFYYAVQYAILFHKHEGKIPRVNIESEDDDSIREKAYYLHLNVCYGEFLKMVKTYADTIYDTILKVLENLQNGHPLIFFIKQLAMYKELHSRRIKSDPAASRTKTDVVRKTYNIITNEEYNHTNPNHKWNFLILHPLPSDIDVTQKDPNEGGMGHTLAIEVDKIHNRHFIPEPFGVNVTPTWDTLLRLLHSLLHFKDYMHNYIIGTITLDDFEKIKPLNWKQTWEYLFKDHANIPIYKLSREKKKTPKIVSKTAELRDLLKEAVLLKETITK